MPYSQMRNPFSSPLEKRTKEERKKSRAERKEFRQERRAERKNKKEIRKTTVGKDRNFRKADEGAGMTPKGVEAYVKPGSKDAKRRKSFCARSKGWTGERGKAARKRWKC
jgi:L,D-peptidoglycan transpeptidase YkuD (ErfK/YbiS/YcfS/YnhG family)